MHSIDFYFDPISPYAALAFERLPEVLAGRSVSVRYVPVLFGAMLKSIGHKGPAEIPGKRDWTYRQVQWLGHRLGVPLDLPAAHPFNPLGLLRLLWATAPDGQTPGRYACERVLRHVWRGGLDAADAGRLAELTADLAPQRDPASDAVKADLRAASDAALARGIFGVPTMAVGDQLFWGLDALDMLAARLDGDPWFDGPAWSDAATLPVGIQRV